MQRRVDEYAAMMHARIAAGRRVSVERVRNDFGQGRVMGAAEAVRRGVADRIEPFDQTLARLMSAPDGRRGLGAADLNARRRRLEATAEPRHLADLDRRRRRLGLAARGAIAESRDAPDIDRRRRRLALLARA
jgi:ClpP class serine protease